MVVVVLVIMPHRLLAAAAALFGPRTEPHASTPAAHGAAERAEGCTTGTTAWAHTVRRKPLKAPLGPLGPGRSHPRRKGRRRLLGGGGDPNVKTLDSEARKGPKLDLARPDPDPDLRDSPRSDALAQSSHYCTQVFAWSPCASLRTSLARPSSCEASHPAPIAGS